MKMFNFFKKKKANVKKVRKKKIRKPIKKCMIILYFRNRLKLYSIPITKKDAKKEYERKLKAFKGKGKFIKFNNSIHKKEDIITISCEEL